MAPAAMTKDFPTGSQAASMLLVDPRHSTGVDRELSGQGRRPPRHADAALKVQAVSLPTEVVKYQLEPGNMSDSMCVLLDG
jgi:hypothetical protein